MIKIINLNKNTFKKLAITFALLPCLLSSQVYADGEFYFFDLGNFNLLYLQG